MFPQVLEMPLHFIFATSLSNKSFLVAAGYYKIWQKERKAMFNRLQIKVYESRYLAYLATSGSKQETTK